MTPRQRKFAEDLGVDIPQRATKGEVSELIDHTLKAKRVEADLEQRAHEAVSGRAAQELLKASGVRIGSIVRFPSSKEAYLVEGFQIRKEAFFFLRRVDVKPAKMCNARVVHKDSSGIARLSVELLYNPQDGYVHPVLALEPNDEERKGSHGHDEFMKRKRKLLPQIRGKLASHELYTNDYGEFWSKEAVARILRELPA